MSVISADVRIEEAIPLLFFSKHICDKRYGQCPIFYVQQLNCGFIDHRRMVAPQ